MNVVFVISSLRSGGAERVCSLLSNYFSTKGINMTILIKADNGGVYYSLNDSIKVEEVKFKRNKNKRKKIFSLSLLTSGINYGTSLYKAIKRSNPDIIISFGIDINGIVLLIAKILRKPVIVSDRVTFKSTNSFRKITRQYLYRLANAVVLLTKYDKTNYYDKYIRNSLIIPNPVLFTNQNMERSKAILCVGDVNRWIDKGFDRMLLVYKDIHNSHPDWELWIAGGGDLSNIKKYCDELGVLPVVKFLGVVKNIEGIYNKASIFTLPSKKEGMPNALLEAMASGCACVSFDIATGPSEIIDDGIDGYLVKDNDLKSFRIRIIELIEDEGKRHQMSLNATNKGKEYDIQKIGGEWIDLMNSIIYNSKKQ